jgi:hypothetical protein
MSELTTSSLTVEETTISPGPASAATRAPIWTASQDVYREPMLVRNLAEVRAAGVEDAANHAAAFLAAKM